MRENGGVETSNRDDGGLFFALLAKAGFRLTLHRRSMFVPSLCDAIRVCAPPRSLPYAVG
jgi:hypothetical protein